MTQQGMEGLSPIQQEGLKTQETIAKFIAIGKPLVEGSNLSKEKSDITSKDVDIIKQLVQAIAPIDTENYRLYAHLQLAAKFARKIGEKLVDQNPSSYSDLNLDELEALGVLHDVGRFITHRYYRNELLERLMLKQMGFREDIVKEIPNVGIYSRKDPKDKKLVDGTVDNFSIMQKIIEIADFCGKRESDGGILTFDEVMNYHYESRINYQAMSGLTAMWPSERIRDKQLIEFSAKVYEGLKSWFGNNGVNLDNIRSNILEEENSTSIKAIIFDVGDVLVPNPDLQILGAIQKAYHLDTDIAQDTWQRLIPLMQAGQIDEEEFWIRFSQFFRKQPPADYKSLLTAGVTTEINPQIKDLIGKLKKRGYTLAIHSDTIPSHARAFETAGLYDNFDIRILSPEIKTTKKSSLAFEIAALKLWLPPQACLFIDDKQEHIVSARQIGMKGIHFRSLDQLQEELKTRGLSEH